MKLGLVTYLWGDKWDLPTLITNCEQTGVLGLELRVDHPHGVEPSLSAQERVEVKNRFADSPVVYVGPGTNLHYDMPDAEELKASIERTKEYLMLSRDCGGTGVKVKPDSYPKDVPKEKTREQIGRALAELGPFAADIGQELRVEIHGSVGTEITSIREIMQMADHKAVRACWNCNGDELEGEGLEYHFDLVKEFFGDTVHVRELNIGDYPYQDLLNLFDKMKYEGWILLECRTDPEDRVAALHEQKSAWDNMTGTA